MQYVQTILQAAKLAKVSGLVLLAICTHETGLKNVIVHRDGNTSSYGICMVKAETAAFLKFKGKPEDLLNPKINAKYAALYLKYQQERYGNYCKSTSAYNSGTYHESAVKPGYPKNLKYVLGVRDKMNKHFQNLIDCDKMGSGE